MMDSLHFSFYFLYGLYLLLFNITLTVLFLQLTNNGEDNDDYDDDTDHDDLLELCINKIKYVQFI